MRTLTILLALLVSGCVHFAEAPFGPHREHQERTLEPPLTVEGDLEGGGLDVQVRAVAHGAQEGAYQISSICQPPWTESMQGPDGPVQHREPTATCEAFGTRALAPDERVTFEAVWNGTLWNDGFHRAPPGNYVWTAAFEVFRGAEDGEFDSRERIALPFIVTVGP